MLNINLKQDPYYDTPYESEIRFLVTQLYHSSEPTAKNPIKWQRYKDKTYISNINSATFILNNTDKPTLIIATPTNSALIKSDCSILQALATLVFTTVHLDNLNKKKKELVEPDMDFSRN